MTIHSMGKTQQVKPQNILEQTMVVSSSNSWSDIIEIEDLGASSVFVDVGCNFRTTERSAGTHTQEIDDFK